MFVPMLLMVEASSLVCGDKAITKVANMFFYYLFPSVAVSVHMYTCLFSSVCAGRSRSSSLEVKKRKETPKKEKTKE